MRPGRFQNSANMTFGLVHNISDLLLLGDSALRLSSAFGSIAPNVEQKQSHSMAANLSKLDANSPLILKGITPLQETKGRNAGFVCITRNSAANSSADLYIN
jgi:hypothetical protein